MMGSTAKDIKEAVLAGSNFVVADMLEAANALVEASKKEDFKSSVESLSRAFNLAEKAEGVATVDSALFENEEEKALAEAVEPLVLSGTASQQLKRSLLLAQSLMHSLRIPWLWLKMKQSVKIAWLSCLI